MKRFLIGFLAGLAIGTFAHAQEVATENSIEQSFADGGSVRLKLSSGDYTVRAGGDHIRVQWQAQDPADAHDMKKITVRADVSGKVATIRTEGPTKRARFVIEIPARSDLHLRVSAGDVRINGIEGNKDVHMTAGDLMIDARPASYSRVHASVTFGDLHARAFGVSKDGIKNSFDWTGAGKYTLHATLFAGDLRFDSK